MYDFAVWAIVTIYFGRLYLLGEFGEGDFATLPFLAFFCHQRSRDTSNSNFFSKCKNIFRPLQDSTGYLIEPLGTGLRTDDTPSARCWDGWTRIFRRGNFETKVRIIDCLLLPKGSVSQRTFHSPQPARLDRQLPDELEVRNRRPCVQERAVVRAQPHQEVMWSSIFLNSLLHTQAFVIVYPSAQRVLQDHLPAPAQDEAFHDQPGRRVPAGGV